MKIPVLDNLVTRFPRISLSLGIVALWAVFARVMVAYGWESAHIWLLPIALIAIGLILLTNMRE